MNIDWKRKLTSRKFWMAVACFVSGLFAFFGKAEEGEKIYGLILIGASAIAYIIGEGLTDAANASIPIEEEDSEDKEDGD